MQIRITLPAELGNELVITLGAVLRFISVLLLYVHFCCGSSIGN